MDLTIAWFPTLKLLFGLGLIGISFYFYKKEKIKLAIGFAIFALFLMILSPVKYDGTNSTKYNIKAQKDRTRFYNSVTSEARIIETRTPTFKERAEADVQVRLTELKGKEQVAKGEYRIKMEEARRIKDYNAAVAEGITPQLLELRKLEVQQELVNAIGKGDTTTIFVPYSALGTTGLQNRAMLTGQ